MRVGINSDFDVDWPVVAWAIFQVTIGLFLLHTGSDSLIANYEIPIVSIRDCRRYIIVSYLSASRDETGSYSISPQPVGY